MYLLNKAALLFEITFKFLGLFKVEERYRNLQNKLDTSEQKYEQLVKKSHSNLSSSDNDFGPKNIAMAQVIRLFALVY